MLGQCWLIVTSRWSTVRNACLAVPLAYEPFANKETTVVEPFSDTLQIRVISAHTISQPLASPIIPNLIISQHFPQIANGVPTNYLTCVTCIIFTNSYLQIIITNTCKIIKIIFEEYIHHTVFYNSFSGVFKREKIFALEDKIPILERRLGKF